MDVSLPGQGEELQELVDEIGLSKGKAPYYIEVYIQKNGRKSALWEHTEKLWPRIFGRAMDVRSEIIQPVLDELSAGGTNRDYLDEIRMRLGI